MAFGYPSIDAMAHTHPSTTEIWEWYNTMCLNTYYNVSSIIYIYILYHIILYIRYVYLFMQIFTSDVSFCIHVLTLFKIHPATFEAPWWALWWRLRIREPQRLARAPSRDPPGRSPGDPSESRSWVIFLGPSWVVHGGSPNEKNMEEIMRKHRWFPAFFFWGVILV